MISTNVIVKSGRDLVNFFFNVPEEVRPFKVEGEAVSRIRLEVCVDGMMFFSEEYRFMGSSPVKPYGKIDIKDLGEGEYTYRIRETVVRLEKDRFDAQTVSENEQTGSFFVSENYQPAAPFRKAGVAMGQGCTNP